MSTQQFQGKVEMNDDLEVKGNLTLKGRLKRETPRTLLKWNYTNCSPPVVSEAGLGDAAGVLSAGQILGLSFPDTNGNYRPSQMTLVGSFTTTGMIPQQEGAQIAADTASTAAGLNVQLDAESSDNCGMQWSNGNDVAGSNSNSFTVGTHSGHIDVTLWTSDVSDYDCAVVGFRKVEAHQSSLGTTIAAGTGDPGYSDIFLAGIIGNARKIQSVNAANGDTTCQVVDTTDVGVNSQNLRVKVSLAKSGAASFQYEINGVAGGGTLQDPSDGTHTFSFDSGDVLVPILVTQKAGAADVELLIKDIEIVRSPGVDYQD